ncbi:flagellar biosynthesis [Thiomicrorhabdus sediminis]|uniref:Flagellar biosynthesis n=2 Tax=Thiomicrorhabdus sediminis TaxID=2580412 RepID=A0A4P9K7S1_9GAMM|nr:flagellar biosynthesis [Thiomicrorhabdus sediminis]
MVGQTANSEAQNYVNIQGLDKLKQQAREDQKSALMPVAQQFEALFVEQVFKESRKVSLDDGWLDGNQGDFYKDWHDKQLAQDLAAKGTLGFADKIVEQLAPSITNLENKNIVDNKATHKENPTAPVDIKLAAEKDKIPSTESVLALKAIR